uniref:Protein kinase C and casein kinase substrate in neurons protein 1-like n=1 Tax=Pundamilia nyererei TaxID=303518 RepID=A0A3B4GS30_9CICH
MSGSYDECAGGDDTMDSFWEVGNYKRAVKRFDDGHRLCNDLMGCLQERAKIEKAYGDQLTAWSKRWRQLIEKGPQYGSVERAWLAVMTEAERVSELHQEVKNNLVNEDVEKVKNWQKEAYHKQMIGGFKEAKEAEEGFKKAQKPWAKKLKEVRKMRKTYHMACKEEKLAAAREANGKTEASVTPDQQKKLHEKVDKCKQDTQKAKEKYEKSLEELSKCTPQYMECMEQVFDQCQQHEVRRLTFLKEALLDIKRHLNLTENQRLWQHKYQHQLERTILAANTQEDLKWFSNNHGPGMHMNWPIFEVQCQAITKKTCTTLLPFIFYITLCASLLSPHQEYNPDQASPPFSLSSSVSSYEKNQAYSTEWSDDEQPAAYSGNENGGNGNSFEDDSSTGRGVRVRALYDYEGQEQDELSFKAGDELTKTEDEDEQGWCRGRLDNGREGLYPANYVEPI